MPDKPLRQALPPPEQLARAREGRPLTVLMWMPRGDDIPGGHRVQFRKTADALEQLGHCVIRSVASEPPTLTVDIVHGFGLSPEDVRRVRSRRVPVAISTIYWPASYTHGDEAAPATRRLRGRARAAARSAVASLAGRTTSLARSRTAPLTELGLSLEGADLLLPNARGELSDLQADLRVTTAAHLVPNAVDIAVFGGATPGPSSRSGVLTVGRLEPHKNQLGLIRACRRLGVPLTVVGPEHPHHGSYMAKCQVAGRGFVEFIAETPYEELPALYRRHQVHALPSWFETTGLSSLEAAVSGCTVVSTSRGHAREYLEGDAFYCDPAQPKTLERAIAEALDTRGSEALKDRIARHFNWDVAALSTVIGYGIALDSASRDVRAWRPLPRGSSTAAS